jgi:hypothetical protein
MIEWVKTVLSDRFGVPRDYVLPIGTHIVLAVGILFLDWDFVDLILIYLTELVVVAALFAVAALFQARPVADHDAEAWHGEPNPVQPVSILPPIYPRNVGLISENVTAYALFFLVFAGMFVSIVDRGVSSLFSPTTELVILGIFLSHLRRVWREFFAEQSYQDRTPADALELGLRPIARFIIIALYVVVPTTIVVVLAVFAAPSMMSRTVILLTYIIPIGAARVWFQGDAVEAVLQHQK